MFRVYLTEEEAEFLVEALRQTDAEGEDKRMFETIEFKVKRCLGDEVSLPCKCGCGRLVKQKPTGRKREWANNADCQNAYNAMKQRERNEKAKERMRKVRARQ